jgi:hypothetical protein
VGRKLTMLLTVLALPGGLMLLFAIAVAVVILRSQRGQRLFARLEPRLPRRLRAPVGRLLALVTGEKLFLPAPDPVPPA